MDLEKLNEELKNKELSKESILRLINLKTDLDMEKVLSAIGALKTETNSAIGSLKESILSNRSEMSTSIGSLKSETNANIGASNSKIDNIKWFIGLAVTIATVIISFVIALFNFFSKK